MPGRKNSLCKGPGAPCGAHSDTRGEFVWKQAVRYEVAEMGGDHSTQGFCYQAGCGAWGFCQGCWGSPGRPGSGGGAGAVLEPCVAGTEGDKPEAGRWEENEDEGRGKRLRPGQGLRPAGCVAAWVTSRPLSPGVQPGRGWGSRKPQGSASGLAPRPRGCPRLRKPCFSRGWGG